MLLDLLKSFGNLDCIFSLSSPNKTNGIIHISRCYKGRTATRGFSQVRTKFKVNSTDGRVVDASRIRDLASGLTQIQERDDLVDLSSRNEFHDSGSGSSSVLVYLCYVELIIGHMTHCLCQNLLEHINFVLCYINNKTVVMT